jgi:hypothetical protein
MKLKPGARIEALYRGTLHTATVVDGELNSEGLVLVDLDVAFQVLLQRGSMDGTRAFIRPDDIVTVFGE